MGGGGGGGPIPFLKSLLVASAATETFSDLFVCLFFCVSASTHYNDYIIIMTKCRSFFVFVFLLLSVCMLVLILIKLIFRKPFGKTFQLTN